MFQVFSDVSSFAIDLTITHVSSLSFQCESIIITKTPLIAKTAFKYYQCYQFHFHYIVIGKKTKYYGNTQSIRFDGFNVTLDRKIRITGSCTTHVWFFPFDDMRCKIIYSSYGFGNVYFYVSSFAVFWELFSFTLVKQTLISFRLRAQTIKNF